jgi:hypothetical protein
MSVVRSIVIAALASASFAGAAYARDAVFTVKLAAPASDNQVIAQNTVWSCEGDTCVARPSHAVSVRACRQFVRQSGARVVAYGVDGNELTADEIARCNGEQATQQAAN